MPTRVWYDERGGAEILRRAETLVTQVSRRTVALAKTRIPVKTGHTRSGINYRIRRSHLQVSSRIGTRRRAALILHEGARAHTIRPKGGKQSLRFYWPVTGQVEHFRSVRHPGVGATPYLTSSLRDVAVPMGFTYRRYVRSS